MPNDIDPDPPLSHAITDGWSDFANTILPAIGGDAHAEAHAKRTQMRLQRLCNEA